MSLRVKICGSQGTMTRESHQIWVLMLWGLSLFQKSKKYLLLRQEIINQLPPLFQKKVFVNQSINDVISIAQASESTLSSFMDPNHPKCALRSLSCHKSFS